LIKRFEILLAPPVQHLDGLGEGPAERRKAIFDLRWHNVENVPVNEPLLLLLP